MDLFDEPLECPIKAALLRVSPPLRMITAPSVARVGVNGVLPTQGGNDAATLTGKRVVLILKAPY